MTTPRRSEVLPQLTPDRKSILFSANTPVITSRPDASPLDGGAAQDVPIAGPLDEFRCSPHPKGRCVLRKTIGTTEFVYFELDPYRGIGQELARTTWWPIYLNGWDISPDGRFVALPNHDRRNAIIRLVRLDPKGNEPKEREITLPPSPASPPSPGPPTAPPGF